MSTVEPLPGSMRSIYVLYTLLGATESAWTPFSALFLLSRGLTPQEIGLTLALMALASFASAPTWGFIADRRLGHARALTIIAGGAIPLAVLVYLMPGRVPLMAACVALWAWKSPQSSIADAIALGRLGGRRGAYGSVRLWLSGGFATFVIVWGALLREAGTGVAPLAYAGMLTVVAAVSMRLTGPGSPRPRGGEARTGSPLRAPRALGALAAFLVSLFLLQAAYFAAENFFALRIVGLGGGALLIGIGNSLQAYVEVPVMAWTSRASRRRRPIEFFAAGCLTWMVVFVFWAFSGSALAATLINLLAGVAFAFTAVGTVVIVDDFVPPRFRATGQAAARGVGSGLAPVVGLISGGLLYGGLGPEPMYIVTAASAAAAAVIAALAVARSTQPASS